MIELEWLVVFGVVGWNEHGNPEVDLDIGEDSRRTKH
jgi:hypothetical protein